MIGEGKAKATVGIYLRSLRTIFNRANIDKPLPFVRARKVLDLNWEEYKESAES